MSAPKKPSKREQTRAGITYAGYHDDQATAIRLYVENRISMAAYLAAFRAGAAKRRAGERCGCGECAAQKASER